MWTDNQESTVGNSWQGDGQHCQMASAGRVKQSVARQVSDTAVSGVWLMLVYELELFWRTTFCAETFEQGEKHFWFVEKINNFRLNEINKT